MAADEGGFTSKEWKKKDEAPKDYREMRESSQQQERLFEVSCWIHKKEEKNKKMVNWARESGTVSEDAVRNAFSATEDRFLTLVRRSTQIKPLIAVNRLLFSGGFKSEPFLFVGILKVEAAARIKELGKMINGCMRFLR